MARRRTRFRHLRSVTRCGIKGLARRDIGGGTGASNAAVTRYEAGAAADCDDTEGGRQRPGSGATRDTRAAASPAERTATFCRGSYRLPFDPTCIIAGHEEETRRLGFFAASHRRPPWLTRKPAAA